MRVSTRRFGEVIIKKQGNAKNQFDKTKSFSIQNTKYKYTIEQLRELFILVTNLTDKYPFVELKKRLSDDDE